MPMTYYKTFYVPIWVILYDNTKLRTSLKWFEKNKARLQQWPAEGFKDTLWSFKNKGWRNTFPEKEGEPFTVNPQMLMMAVQEHLKKHFGPTSNIHFSYPVHRFDRTVREEDYERIFNEVLVTQNSISLSQIFQVAERCHNGNSGNRELLWVTVAPCDEKVLTSISEKVIKVGEGKAYDVDITDVSAKELPNYLEKTFVELINEFHKRRKDKNI